MLPSEELRAQREAVMGLKWVQRNPRKGQACLAMRTGRSLGAEAQRAVGLALEELGWKVPWGVTDGDSPYPYITSVNDHQFSTADNAIEALELAERIAKEAGL